MICVYKGNENLIQGFDYKGIYFFILLSKYFVPFGARWGSSYRGGDNLISWSSGALHWKYFVRTMKVFEKWFD